MIERAFVPVDMRTPDWEYVRERIDTRQVDLTHLAPCDVPRLVEMGAGALLFLDLRHLRASDLGVLRHFPALEKLQVWQSDRVTSLRGIENLGRLRWLALSQLGPVESLAPLAALPGLEELLLTGGVWKDQIIRRDFTALSSLTTLRRLTIAGIRGPTDVTPLLALDRLEHLEIATAMFSRPEIARLAARYPFWAGRRPWLVQFQDTDGCERCGQARIVLLLQRCKRLWCERWEASRLGRTLEEFEALIQRSAE